jgi:hypothetical protein
MMSSHRRIPLDARSEWGHALEDMPHGFAHTWAHCHAIHLTTGLPTYLYCFERDGARVVCPLSERRYRGQADIVTPYGFNGFTGTGNCHRFTEDWAEFVTGEGYVCGYIGLNPTLDQATGYASETARIHNSVFVVDLRAPIEQLLEAVQPRRRTQLRAPLAPRTRLVWDRERLANFFTTTYPDFMRRAGAAPVYGFNAATLSFLCSQDSLFLVGVEVEGSLEAVVVFGYTPWVADYLFGVALPHGRHHSARLLWSGVEHLHALGVPLLNLGGGARPNDGIAEFKRRFGAAELPLMSLRQVYRPEVFRALCLAAGVGPGEEGYFPPYHAPSRATPRAGEEIA